MQVTFVSCCLCVQDSCGVPPASSMVIECTSRSGHAMYTNNQANLPPDSTSRFVCSYTSSSDNGQINKFNVRQQYHSNSPLTQNFFMRKEHQQPAAKKILHLEKGRRNFLRDSSRRKKSSSFPRTALPPVSEEGGVSNASTSRNPGGGPEKVIIRATLVQPCSIVKRVNGNSSQYESAPTELNCNEQESHVLTDEDEELDDSQIEGCWGKSTYSKFSQPGYIDDRISEEQSFEDSINGNDISKLMPRNTYMRSQSLPKNANSNRNYLSTSYQPTNNMKVVFPRQPRPIVKPPKSNNEQVGKNTQKPCNMFTKLTGIIEPRYKSTSESKTDVLREMNASKTSAMNQSYYNTLHQLQTGTLLQNDDKLKMNLNAQKKHPNGRANNALKNSNSSLQNSSTPISMFNERYTKVLSISEMNARKEWADIQKRKAKMREEFFRVPYEECNREVMLGQMGRRFSKSEPKLNLLKSEIKRNQIILRENSKRDSAPIWRTSIRALSPELSRRPISNGHGSTITDHPNLTSKQDVNRNTNGKSDYFVKHNSVNRVDSNNIYSSPQNLDDPCSYSRPIQNGNTVEQPIPVPRRRRSLSAVVSRENSTSDAQKTDFLENSNNTAQKTVYVSRGGTADVHMTRDPSFSHHHIALTTHVSQSHPSVTVTKYKVPAISYREKWEWAQKYCPGSLNVENMSQNGIYYPSTDNSTMHAPLSKDIASSVTSPDDSVIDSSGYSRYGEGIHSPTPSSGYESCTNANSPTPPPDNSYLHQTNNPGTAVHRRHKLFTSSSPTRENYINCSDKSFMASPTECYPCSPVTASSPHDNSFNSDYLASTSGDDSIYLSNNSSSTADGQYIDGTDWSAVSCRNARKTSDSSSTSSSSGCYSGASSPTLLTTPSVGNRKTQAPHHRPMPTAL